MFSALTTVKGLVKFSGVKIDNIVFRLHYKATFLILVLFSILITSRQYVGDPIDCMADEIPPNVMDTYCWIYSTFTVPEKLGGRVGKDVIQPGVSPVVEGEDEVKYHKYYQWVCFVLIFQAILFYTPHYIWKMFEGGRLAKLTEGLDSPLIATSECNYKIDQLHKYFQNNETINRWYAAQFIFCEFLNLINVIGQIFFIDYFLDGEFTTYGWDVLSFTNWSPEDRVDPMARVFPKVTKCTFHKFGASGTIQKLDGLCVLPVNIINEKIYVFLWFWLLVLSIVTIGAMVYRALTSLKYFRRKALTSLGVENGEKMANELSYGDWFILRQLGENVDSIALNIITKGIGKSN